MIEPSDDLIEHWKQTTEGMKKLEYWEKFKSEPLGLLIGGPNISEYDYDIEKVLDECIKQDKTWEELLDWEYDEDVIY